MLPGNNETLSSVYFRGSKGGRKWGKLRKKGGNGVKERGSDTKKGSK